MDNTDYDSLDRNERMREAHKRETEDPPELLRIFTQYKTCAMTMMRLGPGPFFCATKARVLEKKVVRGIAIALVAPAHDPKSPNRRVAEVTTGAIVGQSLEDVRRDIESAVRTKEGKNIMNRQLEEAGPHSRAAEDRSSEEFWKSMR